MTTPTSAGLPVQQAIYDRLTGDATLAGLADVYDEVPETAEHPYVTIHERIETPRNAHGQFGREVVPTLHIWTKYRGNTQGDEIAARIVALLDHQPLAVTGHTVVSLRFEFGQALRDSNREIRHHVVRFRVTTEQE